MAKFSEYLSEIKQQTDELRIVVTEKSGTDCSGLSISEVSAVVENLSMGGGVTPSGTIGIDKNGIHDVRGYANADVNVVPNLQEKVVKEGGEVVLPDPGYDGLSKVIIDGTIGGIIPSGSMGIDKNGTYNVYSYETVDVDVKPNLQQTKTITENGWHSPDPGYEGIVDVYVAVPVDKPNTTSKFITENGEYFASSDGVDGYDYINVSVSGVSEPPVLITKEITTSGTYNAVDDNADGYSTVVVNIESGGGGQVEEEVTSVILPSVLYSSAELYSFKIDDERVLISSDSISGIWLCSTINEPEFLYDSGVKWKYFQAFGDNQVVISGDTIGSGLLYFDGSSIKKIYDYGYMFTNMQPVNGKVLVAGTVDGAFRFDGESMFQLIPSGANWQFSEPINGKCLIGNPLTEYAEIDVYDSEIDAVNVIYEEGGWADFTVFGQMWIITGSHYERRGFLIADSTSASQVYSSGIAWYSKYPYDEQKCVFVSADSADRGIWVYNLADGSFTRLYQVGYSLDVGYLLGDKLIMSSSTSSVEGCFTYDGTKATRKYTSGYYWTPLQKIDDTYLLTSMEDGSTKRGYGILKLSGSTLQRVFAYRNRWRPLSANPTAGTYVFETDEKNLIATYDKNLGSVTQVKVKVM